MSHGITEVSWRVARYLEWIVVVPWLWSIDASILAISC